MRNRVATTRPADVSAGVHQSSSKHVVLKQISSALTAAVDWLRGGYCDEAPCTGYSPLLALNGPPTLTSAQIDRIVRDLKYQPVNTTTIGIAITKTTNHLPTPTQTSAVLKALHRKTSQH